LDQARVYWSDDKCTDCIKYVKVCHRDKQEERILKKVLRGLEKTASWKRVIVFLIGTAVFATGIVTQFFGLIEMNADAVMDSETYYTSTVFYQNLELQGAAGRQGYIMLHLLDYCFMVFLALFLIYTIYRLLRKVTKSESLKVLALIPLVSGMSDLLENLCIDISIGVYPKRIPVLGSLAGYFTAVKMYTLYIVFTLIVVLPVTALIKKISGRKNTPVQNA
jgi:hypothetical protein